MAKHARNEKDKKEKAIVKKDDSTDIIIDEEKLEKIAEERIKQTTLPENEARRINKEIFKNIIIAIGIILYFLFINFGALNIKVSTYLIDLQVFSIISICATIFIFEKAYKKDSDKIALLGIEMLILSICTLLTTYFYMYFNDKYVCIINIFSMIFGIYYVGKSIVMYLKMKKIVLNEISDVRKIIKK